MTSEPTALATDGPFYPAERYAHQQEGEEIGYHESATAVLGRQSGETQEITEPDGAAGYCQYNTQVAAPILIFGFCAHDMRDIIRSCTWAVKVEIRVGKDRFYNRCLTPRLTVQFRNPTLQKIPAAGAAGIFYKMWG